MSDKNEVSFSESLLPKKDNNEDLEKIVIVLAKEFIKDRNQNYSIAEVLQKIGSIFEKNNLSMNYLKYFIDAAKEM